MSIVQEPILLQPMEVSPELRSTKIRLEVRVEEKISGSGEAMREIGGYGEGISLSFSFSFSFLILILLFC
jgi:hypothetical protein